MASLGSAFELAWDSSAKEGRGCAVVRLLRATVLRSTAGSHSLTRIYRFSTPREAPGQSVVAL